MSPEFVASTNNISMVQATDGKMEAAIEVILLCRSPAYVIKDNDVCKIARIEELRFVVDPDRMATLIEHLADMAEQAKEMKAKFQQKGGAE